MSLAAKSLQQLSDTPLLKSSLWQTTPVDCPPGSPPFLNAIIGLVPRESETPESLLEKLQQLERFFGRQQKTILNEPRPLDLDIIAFGETTYSSDRLTIPHPRAHLRKFVLQPLSEIAPDFMLAGTGQTAAERLVQLQSDEVLTLVGSF